MEILPDSIILIGCLLAVALCMYFIVQISYDGTLVYMYLTCCVHVAYLLNAIKNKHLPSADVRDRIYNIFFEDFVEEYMD